MFQTFLLLSVLTLLLVALGRFFLGRVGMVFALVLATVLNFGSYWFSDRIVLRMHGAREVTERESPVLCATVKKLSKRAGLPMPKVYVIPSESPNAFATGRDPEHSAVAATAGILKLLRPPELEGVIGHELAHVEHRDILIGSVAATLAGAVSVLGDALRWSAFWGRSDREGGAVGTIGRFAAGIVAPVAALVIQMAVSRTREYAADAEGARLSGRPLALAAALSKLETCSRRVPLREARPSTAHLFIVNPLHGSFLHALFSTHPPTKDRIARLEAMAHEGG